MAAQLTLYGAKVVPITFICADEALTCGTQSSPYVEKV